MLEIIFHGHACFEIKDSQTSLVVDPWFRDNPLASKNPDEIKVDAILVTHGHFDHLGDAIEIAKNNDATVICTAELANYCSTKSVNTHKMHIGGSHDFGKFWVKLTPAWHGSSIMSENNLYTGMPCGFLIKIDDKIIYHAGDTGLFSDMKFVIGERYDIDLALLPIGDNVVMGPDDALTAVQWLNPKLVIPMHYNTFPVIKQDPESFKHKVNLEGITCKILQPGEILKI